MHMTPDNQWIANICQRIQVALNESKRDVLRDRFGGYCRAVHIGTLGSCLRHATCSRLSEPKGIGLRNDAGRGRLQRQPRRDVSEGPLTGRCCVAPVASPGAGERGIGVPPARATPPKPKGIELLNIAGQGRFHRPPRCCASESTQQFTQLALRQIKVRLAMNHQTGLPMA